MNLLKTTDNGGFPLVLDDFRWIDAGYREAFKALMSPFGITNSTAVILSGCSRSVAAGTVSITSGFVSIGGEICVFEAQSYPEPGGGQFEYFDLELSYDAAGDKVFQSTLNFNTYQYRKAKITVASSVPSGYTQYSAAKNYYTIIAENLPDISGIIRYAANLSQSGTSNPGMPTFLKENDFPTTRPWTRVSQGRYRLDHADDLIIIFPDATKIMWTISGIKNGGTAWLERINNYRVELVTRDSSGNEADDLLDNTSLFIEVHP